MAFTPDGRRAIVASGDRSVRYYDVEGRRDLKRLVGHTASVWTVALAADGKYARVGRHGRHRPRVGFEHRP